MQIQKIILLILIGFCSVQNAVAQCSEEGHSTNPKDSWLSCQTAVIPNSLEPANYHWIYYDLGYIYQLGTVKIWNYNVNNETGKGMKDAEIFYSEGGQNWISGGIFQLPEASGQTSYEGWESLDLKGVTSRFITIAAYSNWDNGACTGLSEVRFKITKQTTAVEEQLLSSSELLVFPNPTNQVLSIKFKNNRSIKELVIVNNAGHEVLRRRQQTTNFTTDVTFLPAGMYYLKILTVNQEYVTSKFVKTEL